MFIEQLEKRDVIHKYVLAVGKNIFQRDLTVFSGHKFSPPFVCGVFGGTYILL